MDWDATVIPTFCYGAADLIERPDLWNNQSKRQSEFDKHLQRGWNKCEAEGILKYSLSDCKYKSLRNSECDEVSYTAQLNPQRAYNRRARQAFQSMNDSFSNERFNFTKIKTEEVLMELIPGKDTAVTLLCQSAKQPTKESKHYIIVNISPIDDCHILFVPELNMCHPQRMNLASLLLAFDLAQLSYFPGFRVGFNSLHAWASVNHLHYHAMRFNYPVCADDVIPQKQLTEKCGLIRNDVMIPGFLFNIPNPADERIKLAESMIEIVDILHEMQIPYTMVITRATEFTSTRAILWPRKSTKDLTPSPCFDVACVEVAGQFPIKTEAEFDRLTFGSANGLLKEAAVDEDTLKCLISKIAKM